MPKLISIHTAGSTHWVGDGFPTRTVFSYETVGGYTSPFLLFDVSGPQDFKPSPLPRGIQQHPHRGFETVTLAYQGEVAHRDSSGGGGLIRSGDVQWMTAGAGIMHEEFHSPAFSRSGGVLEMVQLWVNLPADRKMSPPRYQTLLNERIPRMELGSPASGSLRVIAGQYEQLTGPAETWSPINLWDLNLNHGTRTALRLPEGHSAMVIVLRGTLSIDRSAPMHEKQMALFDRSGGTIAISAETNAALLVLTGEPLNEPIAGSGPFVMNTAEEILQAKRDFASGRFGRIPATGA
ncbi:pirin family protein [Achromobacter marplatensis]|uniref:pirin family protein n=1 Tax=Achromobacter marplatensis TaxID=470868 RepID=UPI0039F6AB40